MTFAKRMVFFLFLQDEKNYMLERAMEKQGKLVTSGYSRGWRNLTEDQLSTLLETASLQVVGQNVNHALKTTFVRNVNLVNIDKKLDQTVMIVKE